MAINKPEVLPPWADSGDAVQPTEAEIQEGWPAGSVPPSRQRFNWILNYCMNGVRYFMRRGLADWDAAESYAIDDRVIGPDGLTYQSLSANTNKTPASNPADWKRWGLDLSDITGGGQQLFTSSGTFTVPAGVTSVIAEVWGAGGGGAGGPGSGGAGGGGAGGGGYSIKRVTGLVPGSTVAVTVGTGGAAGAVAGNGGAGGSSSFGVHCSATGGAAGNYGGTTASPGALGGVGSGGDINMGGDSGKPSEGLAGGSGGGAARGGGGGMAGYVTAGGAGQFPGGGGAGGDATFGGGVGAGGLVFVRWGV